MRLLWDADGPVDYDGQASTTSKDAVLGLSPYGERPPEIWIAAHGPRMLRADRAQGRRLAPDEDVRPSEYGGGARRDPRARPRTPAATPTHFTPGMLAYVMRRPRRGGASSALTSTRSCGCCACCCRPTSSRSSASSRRSAAGGRSGFHDFSRRACRARRTLRRIVDGDPAEVVRYYAFCGTPEQIAEEIVEYHARRPAPPDPAGTSPRSATPRSPGSRSRRWADQGHAEGGLDG